MPLPLRTRPIGRDCLGDLRRRDGMRLARDSPLVAEGAAIRAAVVGNKERDNCVTHSKDARFSSRVLRHRRQRFPCRLLRRFFFTFAHARAASAPVDINAHVKRLIMIGALIALQLVTDLRLALLLYQLLQIRLVVVRVVARCDFVQLYL